MKELGFLKSNESYLVGIDEAGRGPLAGPVVAAAVLYDERVNADCFKRATDSKLLSANRRERYEAMIKEQSLVYGIGIVDNARIDEINIFNATFEAMTKALEHLEEKLGKTVDVVLVDGNRKIKGVSCRQIPIVKGDSLIKTISLASILAKCERDRIMEQAHLDYPGYKFHNHKGYGTKEHYKAIKLLGMTSIHRKSFRCT